MLGANGDLEAARGNPTPARRMWRWALEVACERPRRPRAVSVRGGGRLESRRLAVDGRTLHVRYAHGDGLPVALVHGVIVSGRYLLPLAAELAATRPVLVPDLPGYGLSDASPEPPTLSGLADALIAACRAAGHDRVALVANSFGAQIAVEAALRHPERVERMALIGPTTDPEARGFVRQVVRWLRCGRDEHLSVLALMARDVCDLGLMRAARLIRVMLDDRIEDKLERVRCPALVLRGDRDRIVPRGWAERVTELLPRARRATVAGCAHMPHYSAPLAVAPELERFLSAPDAAWQQRARSG